jgi:hypothetical protein
MFARDYSRNSQIATLTPNGGPNGGMANGETTCSPIPTVGQKVAGLARNTHIVVFCVMDRDHPIIQLNGNQCFSFPI